MWKHTPCTRQVVDVIRPRGAWLARWLGSPRWQDALLVPWSILPPPEHASASHGQNQEAEFLWAGIHITPLESNKMKMLIMKREAARIIRDVSSKLETVIHVENSLAYACNFFHLLKPKTLIYWAASCPHATYLWQAYHNASPHFQFISIFQRHLFGIISHWNAASNSLQCMVTTGLWFWKRKFYRWFLQIKLASPHR